MQRFIYEIYKNGVALRRGTASEISRAYQINSNKISIYANKKSIIKGAYSVKKVCTVDDFEQNMENREETIDYFIRHLEKYGNVAAFPHEDPSKYLTELESRGYKCVVCRFKEIDVDDLTPNSLRKNTNYEYTLTRV